MEQEFFSCLPSELIVDILSILPVRTIVRCKCVCKSWFNLISNHEFITLHHSRSVPRLAAFKSCHRVFRLEDGLNLPLNSCSRDILHTSSSVNGLLFIRDLTNKLACILNLITREYITLSGIFDYNITYWGFGVSKTTGSYKVVKIFHGCIYDVHTVGFSCCSVYTLGTDDWRHIKSDARVHHSHNNEGAFVNGNLHWLVLDKEGIHWISCLDLETESFTTFSPPPLLLPRRGYGGVEALMDCLCLYDNTLHDDILVIWLMKEYGVETSWTKQFVIEKRHGFTVPYLRSLEYYSIGVFEDGDVLMFSVDTKIFSYSKKNNSIQRHNLFGWDCIVNPILYSPSFLSLRRFAKEHIFKAKNKYLYNVH